MLDPAIANRLARYREASNVRGYIHRLRQITPIQIEAVELTVRT